MVRERAIKEIRLVQEQNLKDCMPITLKADFDPSDEKQLEELREQLFANKFCFCFMAPIRLGIYIKDFYIEDYNELSIFKMCVCVTDFYMSQENIYFLE